MNVQDVINAALQGARGRAVVEQRDEQPATDTDIMKLAAALNFIGTNLEDSVPTPEELYAQLELAQQYEKVAGKSKGKEQRAQARAAEARGDGPTGHEVRKQQRSAARGAISAAHVLPAPETTTYDLPSAPQPSVEVPVAPPPPVSHPTLAAGTTGTVHTPPASPTSEVAALLDKSKPVVGAAEVPASVSSGPSVAPEEKLKFMDRLKGYGRSAGQFTGILDVEGRSGLNRAGRLAGTAGALGALGYGGYRLATRGDGQHQEQKTSALRYAAQVGKQRLLEKVAEDAINPAQISAGPAPAFSGEVMPASTPVFGGVSPEHLVALKAQKVRERINSEMRQYVSEVGDNYNLNGHLSIFNK